MYLKHHPVHSLPVMRGIHLMGQIDIQPITRYGRNVLAKLVVGSTNSHQLVVGAHVDHLGHGECIGSRATSEERDRIHFGADDNASGVASVLEAAAQLTDLNARHLLPGNKDIMFAAWSGEELGILGSTYFIRSFMQTRPLHGQVIDAAINLDMVGHLKEHLILQGVGSSHDWPRVIQQTQARYPMPVITQNDPYLPTDSTSFYVHGVPTINFFSGVDNNYHTPRDTPDTLNYLGLQQICEFLTELIVRLEQKTNLRYTQVTTTHETKTQPLAVYLGTIPDYANDTPVGVRLAGVTPLSPADRAGLQASDVIITLATTSIHDIYDYTFALNALSVGSAVKMTVLREGKPLLLSITPQYRE